MTDLNHTQFFDPKPYFTKGGQGKMFRDPKPTDQHRYQAGYTPERMREVTNAPIDIGTPPVTERQKVGIQPRIPFDGPEGVHQVRQVIARSTTPASDFAPPNISRPDDVTPLNIHIGGNTGLGGRFAASYNPNGRGNLFNRGTITTSPAAGNVHVNEYETGRDARIVKRKRQRSIEQGGQNLMHELGHFKSAKVDQNKSADYSTPVLRGVEEAHADDNMVSRYRPDPRSVRKGNAPRKSSGYESVEGWRGLGGQRAHKVYMGSRKTPFMSDRYANPFQSRGNGFQQEMISPDHVQHPPYIDPNFKGEKVSPYAVFNDRRD